jgi:hypothetical protein
VLRHPVLEPLHSFLQNMRGGIQAKLYLARVGGGAWAAIDSLTCGEVRHKLNREVGLWALGTR